jgi:hypothetical protein
MKAGRLKRLRRHINGSSYSAFGLSGGGVLSTSFGRTTSVD